jgi:hypothetical protein
MYKFKSYNYYNNLMLNYNLLYLDYLIKFNFFIVFFNYNQLSNIFLLDLKNEIQKENCVSLMLTHRQTAKIFFNYFKFLSSSIFCIFINDNIKFIKIIKLLNNINFFFTYKKNFSNILNKNNILIQMNFYNNLKYLHFSLFKILFNIIIILLYFILGLLKYLK